MGAATAPLTAQEQADAVAIYRKPSLFAQRAMNANLWRAQRWIVDAITKHRRIAVKACHASGKTFAAALAVLWWITRYPDGIAVTTAPTWIQVEKIMWGEIRKAILRGGVAYPKPNLTELELGPGNYAMGISTTEADRFSGFHGMRVLVIPDEGPGVRAPIWEGIEGIRAGGDVRVLTLGNPVIASGDFHAAFTTQRHSYETLTISAFDTPNLLPLIPGGDPAQYTDLQLVEFLAALTEDEMEDNVRPYLTTRRWTLEKWEEWGKHGNPLWDARVMGRFPKQAADALYALMYLEQASFREANKTRRHQVRIGIDVAGPGEDETVMYVTEGPNIIEMHPWADPDPRGKCMRALATWKDRDPIVNVDSVGMGYYFALGIEDAGYTVNRINVGSTEGIDTERFTNQKGTLHWGLRERLEDGALNGLVDQETISQLSSIKYKHDARGRVVVRSKKEMKQIDGLKSPDRAEALMLAYAHDGMTGGDGGVAFV